MTTQRKNAIDDLRAEQVTAIISHAYTINPKLHLISHRAFRHIISTIGHRDRPITNAGRRIGHWCGDSINQLADATGYKYGAVRDVIWLATTVGILRKVGQSGYNQPMRRTIDIDGMWQLLNQLSAEYPLLADVAWGGFWLGKRGIIPPMRGADTATPIVIQDITQPPAAEVCSDCFGHGYIEVGRRVARPCFRCRT